MMGSMGVHIALTLAGAYLLGSLPFASWVAKIFYGVDITKVGSGNPGMTNVLRTLGWKPALPVAILDAAKGFFSAWLGLALTGSMRWALAAGLLAVIGHSFTCFARFKGGKGVLTGFGVFLFFTPIPSLISLAAWSVAVALTRYVSLGSIVAAVLLPISIFTQSRLRPEQQLMGVLAVALLVCGFVLFRHRGNMSRLLNGTELKFGNKNGKNQPETIG